MLAEKLPQMTDVARQRIQPVTAQIVDRVRQTLSTSADGSLAQAALKAVKGIAVAAQAKDDGPLTAIVPSVLNIIRSQKDIGLPMSLLPILV